MKAKLGDVVRYRDWQPGDPEIESVPMISRGWGNVGLVISICKSKFKLNTEEFAVQYIDNNGDIHTARLEDIEVLVSNESR